MWNAVSGRFVSSFRCFFSDSSLPRCVSGLWDVLRGAEVGSPPGGGLEEGQRERGRPGGAERRQRGQCRVLSGCRVWSIRIPLKIWSQGWEGPITQTTMQDPLEGPSTPIFPLPAAVQGPSPQTFAAACLPRKVLPPASPEHCYPYLIWNN